MNFFANSEVKVESQLYEFTQPTPGCSRILNSTYLEKSCVCCLVHGVPLVKLSSCSHNEYLKCCFLNETITCTNLQISHVVRASFDPEDVKPIILNAVFIPETLPEISEGPENIPDIKEEYMSDESTKSAFEFCYDVEDAEVDVSRVKNSEKPENPDMVQLNRPNCPASKPESEHNYSISNTKTQDTMGHLQSKSHYQCAICSASFAERQHMINHRTKHNQPMPPKPKSTYKKKKTQKTVTIVKDTLPDAKNVYQCPLCTATFDAEAALENHRQEHEKVRFTRSDLYGKIRMVYLTREQLDAERDVLRATEYVTFEHKCHYCLKSYSLEDSLKLHMRWHDKKRGNYLCPICKRVFTKEICMKQHLELHWRRYQCMECGERFAYDRKCIEHYNKQHAGENNRIDDYYACRHLNCKFIAADLTTYRKHLRQIHSTKVPCDECGRVFYSSTEMRYHKRRDHEKVAQGPHKCHHCDKTYAGKNGLRHHVRTHHKLMPVLNEIAYCKPCNKQFQDKTGLLIHLRYNSKHITDDGKKYTCDYCNAKFINKTGIVSHIETKHLSCIFQCDQCNKVVSCSRALKKHVRAKHGDTPQTTKQTKKLCQICGKSFKHKTSLISHLHTHTGERPLQCTRCPATFAYKASLYTHNRLVHKVPKKGVK